MRHHTSTTPEVMPILSAGKHRSARQGACFMEFASYLAGERWSDHPACTHALLATLARDVNDLTTDASRTRLMPLVNRVVGLTSTDPLFSATIAILAASAAMPVVSMERQRALAAGMISLLRRIDAPTLASIAARAYATAPDAERWAQHYLSIAQVSPRHVDRANEAIVHTATIGIALACLPATEPDADARLALLLSQVIEACEALLTAPTEARIPSLV